MPKGETSRRTAGTRRLTLEQAARDWLAGAASGDVLKPDRNKRYNPEVLRAYADDLERHVLPEIGAVPLALVGPEHVRRLVDRLGGLGLSGARVHEVVAPLRAICRHAARTGGAVQDPTEGVELPVARWWSELGELGEYRALCRARLDHVVPVREPLVLISQIYRSGGTLLSQLLDGHPECHAHPHELRIGRPTNRHWPRLDLDAPESWFDLLYERFAGKHLRRGYSKPPGKPPEDGEADVFPFLFLPRLQREIFEACAAARPARSQRDVFDCYFTSYFNAWLDNQNLYSGPKKVVTGMAPELSLRRRSVEDFFDAYPDGRLVSLVRDPRGWYASARRQRARDADLEGALGRWCRATRATIETLRRHPDRVALLSYERLVLETEETTGRLAEWLGIVPAPALLVPTFNGKPIRANSSNRVDRHGVLGERTEAYRRELDAAAVARIEAVAGELHAQALALEL